jgi:hypothetical protein
MKVICLMALCNSFLNVLSKNIKVKSMSDVLHNDIGKLLWG